MKKLILSNFCCILFSYTLYSQACTPQGDEVSYGSTNVWTGYVYDNADFTSYHGYVTEGTAGSPNFDESFGGDNVFYPTNGCTVQTESFSVRYKLTKTFANATYDFTVGGDDGFRLSLDGGATWVINRWYDQGYNTTTYTGTLNGSYNMVLEFYENSGGNRVSFNVVAACSGSENTTIYGTGDIWKGYVYDGINFDAYKGMVLQPSTGGGAISFDQDFGGSNVLYATSGCNVQTETFSVRYRLTKTFPFGSYSFVAGGDDGYRLSFDGGATWVIDRWWDQSYTTATYTTNLSGTYNIVLEFYENGGDNRISLSVQSNSILKIDLLSFSGRKETNKVLLNWNISMNSDPLDFAVERSADGVTFNSIQTIAGASGVITATSKQYNYTDAAPLPGRSYYRLKMTDVHGKITYSYIVSLNENGIKTNDLTLYPTIVTNNTIFCKSGVLIKNAMIKVSDINGRLICHQQLGRLEKGQTTGISLSTSNFAKGIYLITLSDGEEQLITQRIIF